MEAVRKRDIIYTGLWVGILHSTRDTLITKTCLH